MSNITNVIATPMSATWGGSALGLTEGDIEISFTEDLVDITAHQEGTNVLSSIRTGKRAEVALTLKETNMPLVKYMLGQAGQTVTASGAASSVIGWGAGRDFTQTLTQAQPLVFHPVTKASGDHSEDITFWKAYPQPDSFVFSGENPRTLSFNFLIYPDSSKDPKVRLGVVGDAASGDFSSVTT